MKSEVKALTADHVVAVQDKCFRLAMYIENFIHPLIAILNNYIYQTV